MDGLSGRVDTNRNYFQKLVKDDCLMTTSSLLLYIFQMLIILSVVWTSIYNLTYPKGDTNLLTALLSSSLGYVLPHPTPRLNNADEKK